VSQRCHTTGIVQNSCSDPLQMWTTGHCLSILAHSART